MTPRHGAELPLSGPHPPPPYPNTIGVGASWEFRIGRLTWLDKASVNLRYDYMMVQYDDFRDVRAGGTPGTEPLYQFDADVFRLFVSGWF